MFWCPVVARAQAMTSYERGRALDMLAVVYDDINDHYFDPAFGGLPLKEIFDTARARVQRASRLEESLLAIAQATIEINDGHTLFLPPGLTVRAEYGWTIAFVGDTARVFSVKRGSDAERQGLAPGDVIHRVEGITPGRRNLFYIEYMLGALLPRPALRVAVSRDGGSPRELTVAAEVQQQRQIYDLTGDSGDLWQLIREQQTADTIHPVFAELGDSVLVWRYPAFGDQKEVDDGLKRARRFPNLVVDLRHNGGGAVVTLLQFLNGLYRDSTAIATLQNRKNSRLLYVKGREDRAYTGKVIVLVDSRSASASEAFSRTVQLTKRGTVIGDRTMGALRQARAYRHQSGTQTVAFYGTIVATDDFIFPDGTRVEGVGVIPDEAILPTAGDQRNRFDPVMARALGLSGVTRSPEQAGRLAWEK